MLRPVVSRRSVAVVLCCLLLGGGFAVLVGGRALLLLPSTKSGTRSAAQELDIGDQHRRQRAGGRHTTASTPPPRLLVATNSEERPFRPAAFTAYRAQWNLPDSRRPWHYHQAEARDPAWAPHVERNLARRFDPGLLRSLKLETLSLDEIDCRLSSCRLELSWTQADWDRAKGATDTTRHGGDPVGYLIARTGLLAVLETRIPPAPGQPIVPHAWFVTVRGDGRFAASQILLFGKDEMDPSLYAQFVDDSLARLNARASGKSP
jgi:hypothetical protein